MELYMSIIKEHLKGSYDMQNPEEACRDCHALSIPQLFHEQTYLSPEHVYIGDTSAFEASRSILKDCSLIGIGTPSNGHAFKNCEVVFLSGENADIYSVYNEIVRLFHTYELWEKRMEEICRKSRNLQELLVCSEEILGNPCILFDRKLNDIGHTRRYYPLIVHTEEPDNLTLPLGIGGDMRTDPDFIKLQEIETPFIYDEDENFGTILCYNIFYHQRYYGRLILHPYFHAFTTADEEHLQMLGHFVREIIGAQERQLSSNRRIENIHTLIRRIVVDGQSMEAEDFTRILAETDWQEEGQYTALLLVPFTGKGIDENVDYLCSKIEELWTGSAVVTDQKKIYWLLNLNQFNRAADYNFSRNLGIFLREILCQAGISCVFSNLSDLKRYFSQAEEALYTGRGKNSMYWYHRFADISYEYLMNRCTREYPAEDLYCDPVKRLIHNDTIHGTALMQTLYTYFLCQYNITRTAEALYLHRTSLAARIKKIEQVGMCSFEKMADMREITLSLLIWENETKEK